MTTARRVISTNYSIDVPVKELLTIMVKDGEVEHPLYMLLIEIDGISDVDYNGHFGPHIYITLDIGYDNEDVWKAVHETIENYL